MSEILRPPKVTNIDDGIQPFSYFGYSVTADTKDHCKITLTNFTDNQTLFDNSITNMNEFDYIEHIPELNLNKHYTISIQAFDKIGDGGGMLLWDWWIINNNSVNILNSNPISSDINSFSISYTPTVTGLFHTVDWSLTNLLNETITGSSPIDTGEVVISATNLTPSTWTYTDNIISDTYTMTPTNFDYTIVVPNLEPIWIDVSQPEYFNYTVNYSYDTQIYYYNMESVLTLYNIPFWENNNISKIAITLQDNIYPGGHISIFGFDGQNTIQIITQPLTGDANNPYIYDIPANIILTSIDTYGFNTVSVSALTAQPTLNTYPPVIKTVPELTYGGLTAILAEDLTSQQLSAYSNIPGTIYYYTDEEYFINDTTKLYTSGTPLNANRIYGINQNIMYLRFVPDDRHLYTTATATATINLQSSRQWIDVTAPEYWIADSNVNFVDGAWVASLPAGNLTTTTATAGPAIPEIDFWNWTLSGNEKMNTIYNIRITIASHTNFYPGNHVIVYDCYEFGITNQRYNVLDGIFTFDVSYQATVSRNISKLEIQEMTISKIEIEVPL